MVAKDQIEEIVTELKEEGRWRIALEASEFIELLLEGDRLVLYIGDDVNGYQGDGVELPHGKIDKICDALKALKLTVMSANRA